MLGFMDRGVTLEFLSKLTNSEITALSSICIAFFAFIVAVIQGYITRKHNVLSLRPMVEFSNKIVLARDISLCLVNHGVGPAIITSIYYLIDNNKYELTGGNDFKDLINRMELPESKFELECNLSIHNTVIPAAGESVLLKFKNISSAQLSKTELNKEILRSLPEFLINYKCVYNKKYTKQWTKNLADNMI